MEFLATQTGPNPALLYAASTGLPVPVAVFPNQDLAEAFRVFLGDLDPFRLRGPRLRFLRTAFDNLLSCTWCRKSLVGCSVSFSGAARLHDESDGQGLDCWGQWVNQPENADGLLDACISPRDATVERLAGKPSRTLMTNAEV